MNLLLLNETLAICRMAANDAVPKWASNDSFVSITRTADELSIVCAESAVPSDVRCEKGWRAFRVAGVLDFSQVGVLASILTPLADAYISVFCLSTFDTDYVLVRTADLVNATAVLQSCGYHIID